MRVLIFVLFLLSKSLIAESNLNWEFSLDNKSWNKIQIPFNFAELPMDRENDEYYLRCNFHGSDFDPNSPLSMRAGIILDRERVWLNGNLIGGTDSWNSERPQGYDKIRIYHFPEKYLFRDNTNSILFKIKRYFPDEIGIAQDRIEIGNTSKILADFHKEETIQLLFLAVYLTVSAYFGFLFLRRRNDKEYLFFALFAINLVIYQFLRTQTKFILPLEFWELKKLEYLALPSFIPLMAHFLRVYFKSRYSLIMKVMDGVSVIIFFSILNINDILILDKINRILIQPVWGIYSIQAMYLLIKKNLEKDFDAFLLIIGIISIIFSAIIDILSARYVWNFPRVSGYVFIANVIFQAFLLANRFVRLNKEVEDLNSNLEEKVITRTEELNNSLSKIQTLKIQQDGDYFLTSLLLKPLHYNASKNENLQTQSVTIQKKEFEFKNKKYQIGGDLTITDDLTLNGEEYTMFVNSDAMGKSIQGAGGALILGVLIRSLLSRQDALSQRSKYPERWIKDAFLDIQKAFESFDGSMFVSMILGLIHKKTGFLYYFNAEHPSLILYRNGKAKFLDSIDGDYYLRKMGIFGNDEKFQINTFQLEENDTIVMGTDGRDDIILNQDDTLKVMNEDEKLFLRIIEESQADMDQTITNIKKYGGLSDDISLLKIKYQPQGKNKKPKSERYLDLLKRTRFFAKKEDYGMAIQCMEKAYIYAPDYPKVSLILGRLYMKISSYQLALNYFQKTLENDPGSTEAILLSAFCFKKLGLIRSSIDTAERLRIRDPHNKKAIQFLEKIYNYSNVNSIKPNTHSSKLAA
jgi:tetratricopeptide (TPR) repeat protein